jgi:nucleotidyltransferase substrate binding protein (TIGR01987 family)
MNNQDIRWLQRFSNYEKALNQLRNAVQLAKKRELSELEQQGMIQSFEYTHELAWKTLKDFLEDKGYKDIYGSKDTIRLAFKTGLIQNGEIWMDMIVNRNQTSHTYNEETSQKIVNNIKKKYFVEFQALQAKFTELPTKSD